MDEAKPWMCPSKEHVLGLVVRNGSGVRQLLLYREAIAAHPDPGGMDEVDVMAMVEGYVADVRCSICGRVRTWVPGQEAMERLMESAARMRDGQRSQD